jgi:hypothetical protein
MATTKSASKRSTSRNGSGAKSSSSRKGSAAKRSTANRGSANGRRTKAGTARSRSSSTSSTRNKGNVESIKDTAVDRAKDAGQSISEAAGKAKTPLIAGGTALLGVAAGAAINGRLSGRSKGPIKRIRGASMPKAMTKLDLDAVKSAADRVSAYGQQASDIAAAVEKTRKKNA